MDFNQRLNLQRPLAAVPHLRRQSLIEFGLVADEEDAAFVYLKGAPQLLFGFHIQMVGGLVQKEDVGLPVN